MTDLSREAIDEMKHELWKGTMTDQEFIEQVFEIAFGDNAINRGFYRTEVLARLRNFSNTSHDYEELVTDTLGQYNKKRIDD